MSVSLRAACLPDSGCQHRKRKDAQLLRQSDKRHGIVTALAREIQCGGANLLRSVIVVQYTERVRQPFYRSSAYGQKDDFAILVEQYDIALALIMVNGQPGNGKNKWLNNALSQQPNIGL